MLVIQNGFVSNVGTARNTREMIHFRKKPLVLGPLILRQTQIEFLQGNELAGRYYPPQN